MREKTELNLLVEDIVFKDFLNEESNRLGKEADELGRELEKLHIKKEKLFKDGKRDNDPEVLDITAKMEEIKEKMSSIECDCREIKKAQADLEPVVVKEAKAEDIKSDSVLANKVKAYLSKYGVPFTYRIDKHVKAMEKLFHDDPNDILYVLVGMPENEDMRMSGYNSSSSFTYSSQNGGSFSVSSQSYSDGTSIVLFMKDKILIYHEGILRGSKVKSISIEKINDFEIEEGIFFARLTINYKQTGNMNESRFSVGRIKKDASNELVKFLSNYKTKVNVVKETEGALAESRLPEDGSDPQYGVPEQKKYPLFDKAHVESAIRLFGHVDPQYEGKLAKAILIKMKQYGIPYSSVGKDNPLYKYIPKSYLKKEKE